MGKTETIKERAIYVYLPSLEMKERWEKPLSALTTAITVVRSFFIPLPRSAT
ncbi:MAG: hypothetical protein QXE76_06485 [Candidatus Bathyarchaeia archaeon]